MAETEKDDLAEIHREAMQRFDNAESSDHENRNAALDDQKFRAGEQWDKGAKEEREGRPCLTINRMPQFIRQITGDVRQNKPGIKVRPVEDADVGLAEVYTGLIRHIEQKSDADTAYITAVDCAATSGIGWFRIGVEWCDDGFKQDIRIKRILNPFSVLDDPMATEIDRSDARYRFILERMSKDEFKAKYPKASLSDIDSGNTASGETKNSLGWFDEETVRIAEYWVRKSVKKTIGLFGDQVLEVDSEEAKFLGAPTRTREVETYKIQQYIISGAEVLEGPHDWAGQYIPIIPVIGEEVAVGERTVRHGLVRFAKDAQKAFNYMRSASVEAMAMQPKSPFVVTIDQIKNTQEFWDNAGRKNYPYLPYTPDPKAAGVAPQRAQPAVQATGLMQEAALAVDDMYGTTGIYPPTLGAKSNETSGRAIIARDKQGDTGTYGYIDNLSKAIAAGGRVIVDLIPKIYDTERVVRTLGEDGSEAAYIINKTMQDQSGQEVRVAEPIDGKPGVRPIFMKDDAKYDVVVTTGPSYATKRQEAAESTIQLVSAVPMVGQIAPDLIVKSLDLPGNEELAKRLKKTLPPGLTDPDPNEPPPPPPPPSKEQVEMEMMQQRHALESQKSQGELALKQQQAEMDASLEQQRMAMQAEMDRQKMQLEREKADQEMAIAREKAQLEIDLMLAKAQTQLEIDRTRAAQSSANDQRKADTSDALARRKAEQPAGE